MLCLIAERGPDTGHIFTAECNRAVVGQSGEIALSDHSVSRYHALIQVQPNDTIVVTDLNSATGTWLGYGERPAEQLTLKVGMCFKVGNTVLRIYFDQTEAEQSTKPSLIPQPRPHTLHLARQVREAASRTLPPPPALSAPALKSNEKVQADSRSLELEFDPDILAMADQGATVKSVEPKAVEQVNLPVPYSPKPLPQPPNVQASSNNLSHSNHFKPLEYRAARW